MIRFNFKKLETKTLFLIALAFSLFGCEEAKDVIKFQKDNIEVEVNWNIKNDSLETAKSRQLKMIFAERVSICRECVSEVFDVALGEDRCYILDGRDRLVYRSKLDTMAMIPVVSKSGRGPGEVEMPLQFAVHDSLIAIIHQVGKGLKIIDNDGEEVYSHFFKHGNILQCCFETDSTLFLIGDNIIYDDDIKSHLMRLNFRTNTFEEIANFFDPNTEGRISLMPFAGRVVYHKESHNLIILPEVINSFLSYSFDQKNFAWHTLVNPHENPILVEQVDGNIRHTGFMYEDGRKIDYPNIRVGFLSNGDVYCYNRRYSITQSALIIDVYDKDNSSYKYSYQIQGCPPLYEFDIKENYLLAVDFNQTVALFKLSATL